MIDGYLRILVLMLQGREVADGARRELWLIRRQGSLLFADDPQFFHTGFESGAVEPKPVGLHHRAR